MSGNLCQAAEQGLHVKNSRDSYRKDAIASKPCSRKDVFCGLILGLQCLKLLLHMPCLQVNLGKIFLACAARLCKVTDPELHVGVKCWASPMSPCKPVEKKIKIKISGKVL